MLRKRVALGSAVGVGFLALAWLDSVLAGGPIFHILIGAIMVCTLLEVYALAERAQAEPLRVLPVVLLVVFVTWDYAAGLGGVWPFVSLGGRAGELAGFYAPAGLATAAGFWALGLAQLVARDPRRWLAGVPATWFGFVYVWFIGAHLFPIRGMGMGYVIALIAVAKLGDAGAYFVGSHWGRHRLAPRISPNKTVEGAVGGLAASVLAAVAAALVFGLEGRLGFWTLFGAVVGAAAQLGDLVASAIKRSAGVKDSGNLLSAFGGVLDVVDSPLMAGPVALWLLAA